jgi:Gentisate 1,2-dioxygenase
MSVAALDTTDQLRKAWKEAHLAPLWESPTAHKPPAPPDPSYLWSWERVRPLIGRAIEVANPAAVERRVLTLVNPITRGPDDQSTARTLVAALQILLPGETARPHRHSMNAIRFVLEGEGAVTVVDGKPCPMQFGDLILTPAWSWHEHAHHGSGPMIWLDALDVPLHQWLGTAAFEPGPVQEMPPTLPDAAFAVANVVPDVEFASAHSPVFRYPYADAATALAAAPRARDGARRVRYINPATGGAAMTIMDMHLMQIDREPTVPFRSNSNAVACRGRGPRRKPDRGRHDCLGATRHFQRCRKATGSVTAARGTARLFAASDRDAMARLGILRDEYGNSAN